MPPLIDVFNLLILGIVIWMVSSQGAFSAGLTLVSVLLSGLLAMNTFEGVAGILQSAIPAGAAYMDVIALVGIFGVSVTVMRIVGDHLAPVDIELGAYVYDIGRFGFAVVTSYITLAFLMTAVHTAPLPREFLGFEPEGNNLLRSWAPDRHWLGFNQYVSEKAMGSSHVFDGPKVSLPGVSKPEVLPSFAIRYAARRESYLSGRKVANVPTINTGGSGTRTNRSTPASGGF